MAGLQQIRNALAAVIQAGVPTVNVSPVYLPQVNPPQIIIDVQPQVEVWATLEGAVDYQLKVTLITGATDDPSAQATLDGWLDSSAAGSVVAAINKNNHLESAAFPTPQCDYCVITRIGVPGGAASAGGYRVINWGGVDYVGTHILCEVAASLP